MYLVYYEVCISISLFFNGYYYIYTPANEV